MSKMLACRICLATDDVKLYNLFKYRLVQAYENITGSKLSEKDGLPQCICSFCSTLLLKYVSFKEKCSFAQDLLMYSFGPQKELTIENLRYVSKQFNLTYTRASSTPVINVVYVEPPIKEEPGISDTEVKEEDVIETKVKKRKVKKKKSIKAENYDSDVKLEDFNDVDGDSDVPLPDSSEVPDDNDLNDTDVVLLTKQEQIDEVEARKKSSNYVNSFYKCDKCFKGFITESTFQNHMARHDPKTGDHVCEICLARWPESRSLRAHMVTSHERKYVCRLCDHVSRSSHRAKEHCKWHGGYTFSCKICGASFAKSTSYLTHIRLHHPSSHSCELCGESFIGEYGLRMHKRKAHRDAEDSVSVLPQCIHCDVKFYTIDALQKHVEAKDGVCDSDSRPCLYCGANFHTEADLKEHLKEHQSTNNFNCDECHRSFHSQRSYTIHYQRVHLGVKLKQYKPSLKRPSESVVCEICGKKCITKATLTYHQRTHTGETPYHCKECPKKFSVYQRLQIHIRTHTGESPYKCKHCPKAFKHKAALNRHDRVHTGAKPYSCSHCGKSFSQSNSMKLHVNTVHLKMPAPYRSRRNKT